MRDFVSPGELLVEAAPPITMQIKSLILLVLLVLSGCDTAEKGETAFKKKDYASAVRIWEPLANNGEPLIQDFIARTPAIVDKVRAELPAGFSEKVADRILGGILAAAHSLDQMSPV